MSSRSYNNGVQTLKPETVKKYIQTMNSKYKLPFVSVGSGNAKIEYEALSDDTTINWICVDPDPESFMFTDKIYINPQYKFVSSLIEKTTSQIVGNNILFLNWCEPNDSEYDFEAIQKLKPHGVLAIYERYKDSNGAAGGIKFHKLLDDITNKLNNEYDILFSTETYNDCYIVMPFNPIITWFHNKSYTIDVSDVIIESGIYVDNPSGGCCLM